MLLESRFAVGGVERLVYDLSIRLSEKGHGIVVCTLYDPGKIGEHFIQRGFPFYHHLARNKYDIRALFRLARIMREHKIGVVYLVTQPVTLLWGLLAAKLLSVPVVCLIGNMVVLGEQLKLSLYRLLLPLVSRIVAQADSQKAHLALQGVPSRLITVVRNGIQIDPFEVAVDEPAKRASVGIGVAARVVGIAGRLEHVKGVDIFLHAAKAVLAQEPDVEFLVVGDGSEGSRLKDLAAELGIKDRVHFAGFRKDLNELIRIFDVAVLSSRSEASPIVLLEYMASRRPVVAHRVGSVSEVVRDGVTGILADPGDHRDLSDKILYLLRQRDSADRLADAAACDVRARFSIDRTAETMSALFGELAGDRT
jgi:glycosyltransferase involved in cell wall biosynthesis